MGIGSCNSYPLTRLRFAQLRAGMMEEVGIPDNTQKALWTIMNPERTGQYPDWADKDFVFKHRELKIVKIV